jgi:hypothetical protein
MTGKGPIGRTVSRRIATSRSVEVSSMLRSSSARRRTIRVVAAASMAEAAMRTLSVSSRRMSSIIASRARWGSPIRDSGGSTTPTSR